MGAVVGAVQRRRWVDGLRIPHPHRRPPSSRVDPGDAQRGAVPKLVRARSMGRPRPRLGGSPPTRSSWPSDRADPSPPASPRCGDLADVCTRRPMDAFRGASLFAPPRSAPSCTGKPPQPRADRRSVPAYVELPAPTGIPAHLRPARHPGHHRPGPRRPPSGRPRGVGTERRLGRPATHRDAGRRLAQPHASPRNQQEERWQPSRKRLGTEPPGTTKYWPSCWETAAVSRPHPGTVPFPPGRWIGLDNVEFLGVPVDTTSVFLRTGTNSDRIAALPAAWEFRAGHAVGPCPQSECRHERRGTDRRHGWRGRGEAQARPDRTRPDDGQPRSRPARPDPGQHTIGAGRWLCCSRPCR